MNFQLLKQWAAELGFCDAALCDAAPFDTEKRLVLSQPLLSERKQLRFSPQSDDKRIRSIAVLLWPYAQKRAAQGREVFIDSYYHASNAAYHAARKLEARISAAGSFAQANVSYPAKEAAVRAGLGIIGDHSLLIHPVYGTRVVIILMATDIEEPVSSCKKEKDCLHCGKCAASCPTGAIDCAGMSHPERCLRNFMMEGIVVPSRIRRLMGNRLLGCDTCQRECPMQPDHEKDGMRWSLDDLAVKSESGFSLSVKRLADEVGRNAARPQRVRAQMALLCGNIGDERDLPVLNEWAQSEFDAVKTHALWAIEQIETRLNDSRISSHDGT